MAAKPNQKVTKVAQVAQPKNMTAIAQSIADRLNKAPRDSRGYRHIGVEGTEMPGQKDEHDEPRYRLNINVSPDGNIFNSWNDTNNPKFAITAGLSSPERLKRQYADYKFIEAAAEVVAILRPPKTEAKPKAQTQPKGAGGVRLF